MVSYFIFKNISSHAKSRPVRTALNIRERKYISSHCFRHSHASYLLSSGIDIKSVSERLGHKDVEETQNTYVHVLPSNKSEILNLLDVSLKKLRQFYASNTKTRVNTRVFINLVDPQGLEPRTDRL